MRKLAPFLDQNPEVMKKRISNKNWKFNYDISFNKNSIKDRFKKIMNKYLGIDLGYKNYIIEKTRNTPRPKLH